MSKLYFVLIDYENIQPAVIQLRRLLALNQEEQQINLFIFYNRSQMEFIPKIGDKLPYANINYECVNSRKKNALDSAIWIQIGYLLKYYPNAHFLIISRDKDFDAGIEVAQEKNIFVSRWNSVEELLENTRTNSYSNNILLENNRKNSYSNDILNYVKMYIAKLTKMYKNRPKTERALLSDLKNTFKGKIDEQNCLKILEMLYHMKLIAKEGGKITYYLQTAEKNEV